MKATELWDNEVEWRARDNAATYTKLDTVERYVAIRDSALSIIESLMSANECINYSLTRPVSPRTAQALRKLVKLSYPTIPEETHEAL